MVCHSNAFVDAVLAEKLGNSEVSDHLREQIYQLNCDQFSQLCRAFAQSERGASFTAVERGEFKGVLKGYEHVHYRADGSLASNVALALKFPLGSELDQTVELMVDRHIQARIPIEKMVRTVRGRLRHGATGDWLIYSDTEIGSRRYLAIHPHVKPGSQQEVELRQLLDEITSSFPSPS